MKIDVILTFDISGETTLLSVQRLGMRLLEGVTTDASSLKKDGIALTNMAIKVAPKPSSKKTPSKKTPKSKK